MFFTYLIRELRRRSRQALVIALGLALGIGLTISVSAASAGVADAQTAVLHSLYGVGTDITVTQSAAAGSGGPQTFGFQGQSQSGSGTRTTSSSADNLRVEGGTVTGAQLAAIKKVAGVSAVAGSLLMNDFKFSGSISQSVTQNQTRTTTTQQIPAGPRGGGGGERTQTTIHDNLEAGPPSAGFDLNQTSIEGVDPALAAIGPLSALTLTSGRTLTAADATADVAVISAGYAKQASVKLGGTLTVKGSTLTVVGVAAGASTVEVYIPLSVAQTLAAQPGAVSTVYVKAADPARIDAVAAALKQAAAGSTVSTSADLAKSVTGSLSDTASLMRNLGTWLMYGVLAAAALIAVLFTMSAVSRRVREFGTLKALGWTSRRVVRQVMGESLATGLLGGALGIGSGFAGAYAVNRFAPALNASAATAPNGFGPGGGRGGPGGRAASPAVTVHLTAPVSISLLLLAVAIAVGCGLLAGAFGGWRASSLRPADALRKVA